MSCRAMGGGLGMLSCTGVVLITTYGCGPNIVIGLPGVLVAGSLVVKDKMQKAWLKAKTKQNAEQDQAEVITQKMQVLVEAEDRHKRIATLFARSMVPIVGPWWALLS